MQATIDINDILSKVKQLNEEEQLTLLEKIALLIRKTAVKNKKVGLSAISGVGGAVWNDINIDKYVDEERQW
ncbi:hypothetical protein [Compostibacter hankyongensis]|uniref:DUF2281 domain-containing protein n=1 Tax=Compostibacter hankyongensis TaxID=1007089 RepID=A0ABP8FE19_9BACT